MIKIDYSEKTDYKGLAKLGFVSGLLVLGPLCGFYILVMGFIHWADGSFIEVLYELFEMVISVAIFSAIYLALIVPWGLRIYSVLTGKQWEK